MLLGLAGCGGPLVSGDDSAVPADACAEAAPLTYENFGQAFLLAHCQGCHAAAAVDRHGAPETVTFDTVDEAWAQASRILAVATSDPPTMPPNGGVRADDLVRLRWWLACGEPGT